MFDAEGAAGARFTIISQELAQHHRGLSAQLRLIDLKVENCSDAGERRLLDEQRQRLVDRLSHSQARITALLGSDSIPYRAIVTSCDQADATRIGVAPGDTAARAIPPVPRPGRRSWRFQPYNAPV